MTHPLELFEALREFNDSLKEVDLLCDAAEGSTSDARRSSTFNKAALLFIAGKFEAFAESIAEEFVYVFNDRQLTCNRVPDVLRLHHSFNAIREVDPKNRQKHAGAVEVFRQLGELWVSERISPRLKLDCKLAYGKHGETQFVKLFQQLGIADIFESIQVNEPVENFATEVPVMAVDFRGSLNSVTAMRNNILHEDASPNLTTTEIRRFRGHFQAFGDALSLYLAELLDTYCSEPQPN